MIEGVSWSDIFMNIQDVGRLNGERISDREKLREVCNDFESLFIKMMLDSMRSSLTDSALIPKNEGHKLFEDQLYSEYARKMSHSSRLGIAEMMYRQLDSSFSSGARRVEIIA